MAISLKPLDQQVLVITGASSGIGLATARMAAKRGARVVAAARSQQALQDIVAEIRSEGGDAIAVACDVSLRQEVDSLARDAAVHYGRIDTWVNDAGVAIYGRLDEVSEEDSRRLFDINFWGVVNGSLAALPHLKRQGGALINVGSEVSEATVPVLGMYVASKHAVKGFTDCLRIEIAKVDGSPVSITLIQPTAVDTPFAQHSRNYMDCEPKLPTPMIEPEQVAEAILDAAVTPTEFKKVGLNASLNTWVAKLVPGLGEWMASGKVKDFKSNEPPRQPHGVLFQPSEAMQAAGQTHGPGSQK